MDFRKEREVKRVKKPHKCFGCREKLLIGSNCFYVMEIYEGSFRPHYLCAKCRNYLEKNPEFTKLGYQQGDIKDAILEDEEWRKERERFL